MNKQTKLAISVLIVAIVLGGVYFASQNNSPYLTEESEPIKIGAMGPMTGPLAKQGEWMKNSIELAKEEINQAGKGRKIEVVYEDSKCMPKETITALNKFIDVDKVSAYLGPVCGASTLSAGKISGEKEITGVTPNNNYGKLSDYFFSTRPPLTEEAKTMARFAHSDLDLQKVAVLHYHDDWGTILRDSFVEEFQKLGGQITITEAINDIMQKDFRTELAKIKQTNPDGIYIAWSAVGPIANQTKELDMSSILLGAYGIENPDVLSVAGKNANGIYYTFLESTNPEGIPMLEAFKEKYRNRYNEEPGLMAIEAYDATMALYKAMEQCKNLDSNCIKNNVNSMQKYQGISGVINFSSVTHGTEKKYIIKKVENEQFVVHKK